MSCASVWADVFQNFDCSTFIPNEYAWNNLCFLHLYSLLLACAAGSTSCSNISMKFRQDSFWFHRGKEIIMEITTCRGWFGVKNEFSAAVYLVIQGQTFHNKWILRFWKGLRRDLGISSIPKTGRKERKEILLSISSVALGFKPDPLISL